MYTVQKKEKQTKWDKSQKTIQEAYSANNKIQKKLVLRSRELNMLYGRHMWNLRRSRRCLRKFPLALYFVVFRRPFVSTYFTWSEATYRSLLVVELRWHLPQIFMTCVAIAENSFQDMSYKVNVICVQIYEWYNAGCKYLDGVASRDACFDLCSSYLLARIKKPTEQCKTSYAHNTSQIILGRT